MPDMPGYIRMAYAPRRLFDAIENRKTRSVPREAHSSFINGIQSKSNLPFWFVDLDDADARH